MITGIGWGWAIVAGVAAWFAAGWVATQIVARRFTLEEPVVADFQADGWPMLEEDVSITYTNDTSAVVERYLVGRGFGTQADGSTVDLIRFRFQREDGGEAECVLHESIAQATLLDLARFLNDAAARRRGPFPPDPFSDTSLVLLAWDPRNPDGWISAQGVEAYIERGVLEVIGNGD